VTEVGLGDRRALSVVERESCPNARPLRASADRTAGLSARSGSPLPAVLTVASGRLSTFNSGRLCHRQPAKSTVRASAHT
jgi:hypothetical protein